MGRQKKTSAKAYEVRISTNAIQNIDEISGYFAVVNQQPLNAVKVGDFLYKVIDRIARNPFAFRECQELPTKAKMYRRALCYSWHIIYQIKDNKIAPQTVSRWCTNDMQPSIEKLFAVSK
jgi:plasmid stabilization system protein ParE